MKKLPLVIFLGAVFLCLAACSSESSNNTANAPSTANKTISTANNMPTANTAPTTNPTSPEVKPSTSYSFRIKPAAPEPLMNNMFVVVKKWSNTLESESEPQEYNGVQPLDELWYKKHVASDYYKIGVNRLLSEFKANDFFKKCSSLGNFKIKKEEFNESEGGIKNIGRLYERLEPCRNS